MICTAEIISPPSGPPREIQRPFMGETSIQSLPLDVYLNMMSLSGGITGPDIISVSCCNKRLHQLLQSDLSFWKWVSDIRPCRKPAEQKPAPQETRNVCRRNFEMRYQAQRLVDQIQGISSMSQNSKNRVEGSAAVLRLCGKLKSLVQCITVLADRCWIGYKERDTLLRVQNLVDNLGAVVRPNLQQQSRRLRVWSRLCQVGRVITLRSLVATLSYTQRRISRLNRRLFKMILSTALALDPLFPVVSKGPIIFVDYSPLNYPLVENQIALARFRRIPAGVPVLFLEPDLLTSLRNITKPLPSEESVDVVISSTPDRQFVARSLRCWYFTFE